MLLKTSLIMIEKQSIPFFDRNVSVFNNVHDSEPKEMKLGEFLALGAQYREQIMRLRAATGHETRSRLKKQLPMMTTSGVFRGGRRAECLAAYSGLICIDIDAKDNTEAPDFDHLKENVLSQIKEVAYAARSVGGKGYFAIIPLRYPNQHKQQFKQLQKDFADIGITIDAACSDVCRLRCLSYDEAPYVNDEAVAYTGVYKEPRQPQWQSWQRNGFADDTDERVYQACKEIELRKIDMTDNYEDWIAIGFSLATLGEAGREYFHIVSRQSPKYRARETEQKFSSFLRSCSNGYSIGTFFYYCQRFGVV